MRVVIAAFCLVMGVLLSWRVEPGVRVDRVVVGSDIPALRFLPADGKPQSTVLLTHGVTASKETMFRLGEALAHAGCACFAIDLAGHGESTRRFSHAENLRVIDEANAAIGPLDVYVGHSMGAYAGAASIRRGTLHPSLLVALGAMPEVAQGGPPLLMLMGLYDELLRADASENIVVSPWSDHALEPYDPKLIQAAVAAECARQGRVPPPAPTAWVWRLIGLGLALGSALVLGAELSRLLEARRSQGPLAENSALAPLGRSQGPSAEYSAPAPPGRSEGPSAENSALAPPADCWSQVRSGVLVGVLAVGALALTANSWLGAAPVFRRAPAWAMAMVASWGVAWVARRLRVPRWAIGALPLSCALGCALIGARFAALVGVLAALPCLAGAVVGAVADRSGRRHGNDGAAPGGASTRGDIAFAIFVGYALGQWSPML